MNRKTGETRLAGDGAEFFVNSIFFVEKRIAGDGEMGRLVWLSFHRLDRKPVRDWRHVQRMKNELVGPECEGMEMYPAESRLVDTSNQYHLWVFEDPTFRWPWGYAERMVMDADHPELLKIGAEQRPLPEGTEESVPPDIEQRVQQDLESRRGEQ